MPAIETGTCDGRRRLRMGSASRFGRAYADRLPNSELYELPRAGHWPWIDAPEVIDRVLRFLAVDEEFEAA